MIAKVIGVIVSTILLLAVLLILSAYLFAFLQKPTFVNESLALTNSLTIPKLLQPSIQNGTKIFDLTLQSGSKEFIKGKQTQTWGMNGAYLGPVIRVHTGDKVQMRVSNNLNTATTIHWHGMELPAIMDGVYQIIQPQTTWEPNWTITNQAATLWYHSHLMGATGEQVNKGLAGMIIIDDNNSDTLNLPKQYGVDDLPLIVQDRKFDQSGQFVYQPNDPVLGMQESYGDTILINGTYAPYKDVPSGWVRLRLLNGSNARRYNFGFSDNRPFYQIASDGGLLESPVKVTRLVLAPAERAEILVDMSQAGPVTLMSYAVTDTIHNPNVFINLRETLINLYSSIFKADPNTDKNQQFKLLELRPTKVADKITPLPQSLNVIQRWTAHDAVKTRDFVLDSDDMINNSKMNPAIINQIVYKDDVEIWKVTNPVEGFHTFHVHDTQFLILDRNGKAPAPGEQGWKDTILLNTGDTVRIMVQFKYYTDPHHPYMFHCHVLEHEDMGMMGQFVVVDKGTKNADISVDKQYVDEYSGLMAMPEGSMPKR